MITIHSSNSETQKLSGTRTKMANNEYDKLQESIEYVKKKTNISPKIGIVCGSGLGDLCNIVEDPTSIPYAQIPHFPRCTVDGHSGELVFGKKDCIPVVCMGGRAHLYEGYNVVECIRPIRLMAMLGIKILFLTNAAGNLSRNFKPGNFMIINDHISFPNLSGENPLRGSHDPRFGDRFITMSNAYNLELIWKFEKASIQVGLDGSVKKGVYAMVVGPNYETIAEGKALKMLGADAVGMSTAHEIIAARQMGVKCLGISMLTNDITTDYDSNDNVVEHEQVVDMGVKKSKELIQILSALISLIRPEMKE